MLMAVNVGNSRISVGFFKNDSVEIIAKFKLATDISKTSDEYIALMRAMMREQYLSPEDISGCIYSSVVPQLNFVIGEALRRFTKSYVMTVAPGIKTGFSIKIDNPSELGADIVANTAAVINMSKNDKEKREAAIIVDMNAVTTVSALGKNCEYLGCSIFPGVQMSFDVMHGATAQLPNVRFSVPSRVIGKNSAESLLSGVILGNAAIIDGMVDSFAREMKCAPFEIRLFATGEYASTVVGACRNKFFVDEDMTLKGLYHIFVNNR